LEDLRDATQKLAAVSRTWPPRVDPERMTLRQSRRVAEPGRNAVWNDPRGQRREGPETFLDPDYAAFRRMLLSLASDGHRLFNRIRCGSPAANGRRVRSFLRRMDQFDELVEARGLEPIRRWARRLRSIVLEAGEDR
jgi:hypothetical protein